MDNTKLITFRIDSLSPETIPMARLAEYLKELSALYGSEQYVHFAGITRGSAKLAAELDEPAVQAVRSRLTLVKCGAPPADALKAYVALDKLLKSDNAAATIYSKPDDNILVFPGRNAPAEETISITQPTTVDGVVIKIGGRDDTIPVLIKDQEGNVVRCVVKGSAVAKRLAHHYLDKPIRVHGAGRWTRNGYGWKLESLSIQTWETIDDQPAFEILNQLRNVEGNEWLDHDDPVEEWRKMRGLD